jgi:Fic family protein
MDTAKVFAKLWEALEGDSRLLAEHGRGGEARRRLFLEEVHSSTALGGSPLALAEVAGLVEHGSVPGGRLLADCILVADYAEAAAYVRAAPPAGRRQPFLRLDEIVALHARAMRRTPEARPGIWRTTTLPAFPSGMVPPPAWLIARDMAAFSDRYAAGPAADVNPLLWVVNAHARFTRLQPFAAGNGRTARLLCNLLLGRLGLPPLIVAARDRERYGRDRVPAGGRGVPALALLFARSLLASTSALLAATREDRALQPLATFATGAARAALYKAAQRNRLRTVRRGPALLTTAGWIDDYRRSRHFG